jgi:hypothetical protein
MKIVNRPLNHRRWKLIYLLTILLSLMFAPIGKADITQPKTQERVEYHWPALQNYNNLMKMRQMLYGKTPRQAKKKAQIPDAEPTPHPSQIEKRRERAREHTLAQGAASRSVALLVRGQDHRRSRCASPKSPPGKRTVYRKTRQMFT